MDKIKERLEAVRKAEEHSANLKKMQAQLEALISEFQSLIDEADNASNENSGSAHEGGSEDSLRSVEVGRGTSEEVQADRPSDHSAGVLSGSAAS